MSRRPDQNRENHERWERLVADAFSERGEMVPTTELEVARMEADLEDHELRAPPLFDSAHDGRAPASAGPKCAQSGVPASPHPRAAAGRHLRRVVTGPWLSHGISAALGALAAAVALWWSRPALRPVVLSGTGEATTTRPVLPRPAPEVHLSLPVECHDCCGGTSCSAQSSKCPSGRRCIPCGVDPQARFRLRVGAVNVSEAAAGADGKVPIYRLCVAVANERATCMQANGYADESEPWRVLPRVVAAQDMLAGVRFELRSGDEKSVLALWSRPVVVAEETLCKGLFVPLKTEAGEPLGSVSAFLQDAQYVEIARAGRVGPLAELGAQLSSKTVAAQVMETTGAARFALVVGPLGVDAANRVRWQLLEAGLSATVTTGHDLVGLARPQR
ncbi:MAG: hypothetical protein JW940_04985 [Polyangiaceae bacterium]|nr:hypothetical protein [Polyangiaceae bacterium]